MLNKKYIPCSIEKGIFSGQAIYKFKLEYKQESEGICHPSHLLNSDFTPLTKKILNNETISGYVNVRPEEIDPGNPSNLIVDLPRIPGEDKQTVSLPKKCLIDTLTFG